MELFSSFVFQTVLCMCVEIQLIFVYLVFCKLAKLLY